MSDDLISRAAAIDGFYEMASNMDHLCTVGDYVSFLESLSSSQAWIPVNERLPKGRELVNVSCHDDSGDTSYDYSSCGWVTDDGEYWIVDNEINGFVVAWMPLPEPYEEKKK